MQVRSVALRLASLSGVILLLTLFVFAIQYLLPADPVVALVGPRAGPEALEAKREELGLDQPLPSQYWLFLSRLIRGDLGDSLTTGRPVATDILAYAPATIELAVVSFAIALTAGFLFGVLSGARLKTGGAIRVSLVGLSSFPAYFVALVVLLLATSAPLSLPISGRISREFRSIDGPTGFLLVDTVLSGSPRGFVDAASHLILPSLVLALIPAAAIGRVLRSTLIDELRSEYVATARALGSSTRQVLFRQALPNSLRPVLSIAGLQFGALLTGAIVIEGIFNWPGLGQYGQVALQNLDFPAVLGLTILGGAAYVLVNFVVEMLQGPLTPKSIRSRSLRDGGPRE